jgi:putative CocE/NonD family hydrolase
MKSFRFSARIQWIILLSALFIQSTVRGQDITGIWNGQLEVQGTQLRLVIHISEDNNMLKAAFDSPDQDVFGIDLDTISFNGAELYFAFYRAGFTYTGQYNEDGQTFKGTFIQAGQSFDMEFIREIIEVPKGSLAYIRQHYDKQEIYIPMRDGIRLFTSVYTPKDTSRSYPFLLNRTPYNCEPNADRYSGNLIPLAHLLEEGYIIVLQDVRGRFMSEGKFEDVRPFIPNKKGKQIDENSDTYDTIDWLLKNVKNNNGRAGILGISYPGFYSTMALPEAHPALKAASPQAPVTNWFIGDDWHHNGAFFLMDAFNFYSAIGRPRPEPTRSWPGSFQYPTSDNYDFFLDIGPIKNIRGRYFGDSIQFWKELMTHPNYDEFWKARDPRPHLKNIQPAVLVVGGWFDAEDLYGPLRAYEAIEKQSQPDNQNRLIMGPWSHGQWARSSAENLGNIHFGNNTSLYFKDIEHKFFEYYLKDKGNMDLPEAQIFITGINEWKGFDSWPPKNAEDLLIYLNQDESITMSPPTQSESYVECISDPHNPVPYTEDVHLRRTVEYLTDDQRFADRRPDVFTYKTDPLEENLTLTGPVRVQFYVSTTGTDSDYVVKLIDVFPDDLEDYPENDKNVPMAGYQMLVRGEVLRGRFRNSFEKPEPFIPNEITEVSFEIPDLAHTFQHGHRLMVQVQHSWFPLVDRNPQQFVDIYSCDESDFIKATHRLYHDATRPSHLAVKVLK